MDAARRMRIDNENQNIQFLPSKIHRIDTNVHGASLPRINREKRGNSTRYRKKEIATVFDCQFHPVRRGGGLCVQCMTDRPGTRPMKE